MMSRYIDADKIISHLTDEIEACENPDVYSQPVAYGIYLGLQYARLIVETAETTDVQKIKHGKWLELRPGHCVCSRCKKDTCCSWFKYEYCERCGAKMDGKENKNNDKKRTN